MILNQVDLSSYGESLLGLRIDIEDYFDLAQNFLNQKNTEVHVGFIAINIQNDTPYEQ